MKAHINKKVFYVKNLDQAKIQTLLGLTDAVIDVRKLTLQTYYIDKSGEAKQLKPNDYHEVLIVRTKEDDLTNLRGKIKEYENYESFVSGKDQDVVKSGSNTVIINKMYYTGAILVNLKAVSVDYNYQDLVDNFQKQLQPSFAEDVRVVYTNVYQNQLKVIFTVNQNQTANLNNLENTLKKPAFTQEVFKDDFKPIDETKVILTNNPNTPVMSGGASRESDDSIDKPNYTSKLSDRIKDVYKDNGKSSIENENKYPRHDYEYDSDGDKMKVPFSLNKKMVENFMSLDIAGEMNPYKIANDPNYYMNFMLKEELNVQKYVTQLKNIQELVTNTETNNEDLRTIIDIVNDKTTADTLKDLKEELKIDRSKIDRINTAKFDVGYEEKAKNYDPFLLDELPTDEDKLYTGEHVQTYLNRCYELEKLYLVKHQEFLYLKNVFDKSFIFYLMTFIVFFYYIKSLGIEEVKECRDLKVKIPKLKKKISRRDFISLKLLEVKNKPRKIYRNSFFIISP